MGCHAAVASTLIRALQAPACSAFASRAIAAVFGDDEVRSIFRRRSVVISILLFLAAGNMWLLLRVRESRRAGPSAELDWEQLRSKQAQRVADWALDESLSTSDPAGEWAQAVSDLPAGDCLILPPDASRLSLSDLTEAQKADLNNAVVGLLDVYIKNSPELLFRYMSERGEASSPQQVKVLRQLVSEVRQTSEESLQSLGAEDLLIAYWRGANLDPHWSAVLSTSGCRELWTRSKPPDEALRQAIGNVDADVFQNLVRFTHNFQPVTSLDEVFVKHGTVLFADVKVVILLSPDLHKEPVPYFMRFWFDPDEGVWHPFQLARVDVGDGVRASRHVF